MRVQDKIALVTGAGRGIGRAIALTLAREGAHLAIADIREKEAELVAEKVRALGREAITVPVDVTQRAAVEAMIQGVADRWGRLDILCNNAGIVQVKPLLDLSDDDWDQMFAVNTKGVFLCTQAGAKLMMRTGNGRIINTASIAGKHATASFAHYAASKAAVISLTQSTARALARYQITVNADCPGIVDTAMWEYIDDAIGGRRGLEKGAALRRELESVPLRRVEDPQDVANLVLFLASDEANYMTGQAINVDGGLVMMR
ncbi:MAG TPA: SDR family NAD(P)-dependent oxidoreductase [Dehalococcoidia bacterium]|nr:SDR family NAD(P)-dependent oxidoreductase [Dehalococcoidia bacterium]